MLFMKKGEAILEFCDNFENSSKMKIVGIALFLMLLVSCASLPPVDSRITMTDGLQRKIAVTNLVFTDETAAGLYVIQADFENLTSKELPLEWKVQWLNDQGLEVETLMASWRKVTLAAHETKGMKAIAPTMDAVQWRMLVRKNTR